MMVWDTQIGVLLSCAKFWSTASLQSTCWGKAVELELKLSLLIEQQRRVLVGNGNFDTNTNESRGFSKTLYESSPKEGH